MAAVGQSPIPPREVVLAARALVLVDAAVAYGFVTDGGLRIDVEMCEDTIALGEEHGIVVTHDEATEAAVGMIAAFNQRRDR